VGYRYLRRTFRDRD